MEIDEDDEFGDLYTDVLHPISSIPPHPSSIPNPFSLACDDQFLAKIPRSDQPLETLAHGADEDPKEDWMPDNWDDDADDGSVPVANFEAKSELGARASGSLEKDEGARVFKEANIEIGGDFDHGTAIPRVSAVDLASNGDARVSNSEDWDSDSEDDLQIVLNDSCHAPMGLEMNEEEDDEDRDEDFILVTNQNQQLLHREAIEGQDWGEGELQPAAVADGERKEGAEASKANGAVGIGAVVSRIGYSNHGFHPQHHSMFKYIRPDAAAPATSAIGPPGQIRPPSTMGSLAGHGRGDWRPRSFHRGFGSGWTNNSFRAFARGLDFTLPSYKTVFDVDIESFEEKLWRHPGIDISDYFNFGLDEDNWKEYSKQLEQIRIESTMQRKIRVYESGRSEQEYDPDLPPELAAAAGHHDISAANMNHVKIDNGQSDFSAQGRVLPYTRAPFPPGRAIQVETGYGERLPSIDTRLPRNRDSDAIIEIVLQDSMEDSTVYNSAGEQTEKDVQGEELTGLQDAEGDRRSDSEYHDRFQRPFNGHRRELGSRRNPHAHEADGGMPFPLESPLHYDPNSKFRSPANPAESFGTHRGGRLAEGPSRGEYSGTSAKHSKHSIPSRSPRENTHDDNQKERPGNNMEPNQASEPSPTELRTEHEDDEHDDVLALGGDSIEIDDNETSDFRISEEAPGDDNSIHSSKKQKLSSRVEQTAIGDNGDDLRATQSDNSVAKSGSSNRKRRENSDEEVQDVRSKKAGNARKHHEEEHTFRRKDDYGREDRHEMDKKHLGSKGREAVHHSYPYRDWESNSVRPFRGRNEGFERLREPNIYFWQKRDHYGEAGSSNRSKIRVSDRNDKGNDARIEKRLDVVSSRRDNLVDGHQFKRKKDEEHSRRERTEREDSSHGYKAREDSSQRKGERDDNPGHRRRAKVEDHHSSKNKDESWCQKEREDRLWVKHPHEDPSLHRESRQNKSDSKILVSDKDCRHRDKRWHGERDSQHKGREDGHAREKKYANEERSLKHEMLDVHSTHSDSQQISRETDREKDAKGGTQNPLRLGKRKHEDHGARRNEKVSSVSINQQESSKMEKQKEGATASNDESQRKSKRGRSKMERWASHKGRDVEHNMNDTVPTDELPKIEGNIVSDSDDRDGHLDTVAKLKRRSERFKLPMPGEKDGAVSLNKRSENDTQLTQNEAPAADAEVKPERPARKRRWTNS